MASIPPKAREAIDLARRGEVSRAILAGEAALTEAPDDGALSLFVGLLHARRLDLGGALPHLRRAAALIPGDPMPRIELARALIAAGALDEAEAALAGLGRGETARLRALLDQRRGRHREAAHGYRAATTRDPHDFESWSGLGETRMALGDMAGAVDALARSLALRPHQAAVRARLAEAQAAAGQAETGLAAAKAQARALPYDPLVRVTIARLEDLLGRPAAAEAALRQALRLDCACVPALLALADLAERDNRIDELETLIARAESLGVPPADTALPRARLAFRRGAFEDALAAARAAPDAADGGARAELIGRISDRLGDSEAAFTAFAEMNRRAAAATAGAKEMAADFRARIRRHARATTPMWFQGWAAAANSSVRPSPIFLLGFPRSGTTLLDTMLAGHPGIAVIEEQPVLHSAALAAGGIERIAALSASEVAELRELYFETLDALAPETRGKRVVDKLPLGSVDAALIHRLFPDAPILFAERHPCDVVLSGFMTRFDPRGAMANFLTLEDNAALYDAVMDYWAQCRAIFPLQVHAVRYERMIEDPEAELRAAAAFLGLAWDDAMLDHVASARTRAFIGTPSYAQVAEPLYTRAKGRWEKYRAQLAPVLPVLAPWAARMGY
ncbi:MAG TPA: sulfotransferase, partial [Allosphingosinicella sp.]|nr:sulfotransferase [Allosphingosinicella sp.]